MDNTESKGGELQAGVLHGYDDVQFFTPQVVAKRNAVQEQKGSVSWKDLEEVLDVVQEWGKVKQAPVEGRRAGGQDKQLIETSNTGKMRVVKDAVEANKPVLLEGPSGMVSLYMCEIEDI